MRILLVADGRSPTTRRWIKAVVSLGHEVTLVTTFPCSPVDGVVADVCLPVAFSALSASGNMPGGKTTGHQGIAKRTVAAFRPTFLTFRHLLGPLTLNYYGPRFRWLAERIQPDLIHALRIPFEGMLASYAPVDFPLAISIWGNDLTLHATGSARMAKLTRKTLMRADGLLADANRDVRLARSWGFAAGNPALVVPGSGGLDLNEITSVRETVQQVGSQFDHLFPVEVPLVINPRGFRTGSVRQDTFFAAIPFILQRRPSVSFACAAMAGEREALRAVERYNLKNKVVLLPHLPQADLWGLFARAAITVSVSQHDGTPNTLLEAMALGALPVAGDIESIREWITPGVNGLLVEPTKPNALAEAVLLALDNQDFLNRAAEINTELVAMRASAERVHEKIRIFYDGVAASREIPV
jgi:glycosyltransferase involved in cell wall biosynthesis